MKNGSHHRNFTLFDENNLATHISKVVIKNLNEESIVLHVKDSSFYFNTGRANLSVILIIFAKSIFLSEDIASDETVYCDVLRTI